MKNQKPEIENLIKPKLNQTTFAYYMILVFIKWINLTTF